MASKRSAPPPPPPAAASDEESEYSGSGWSKDDERRILNALAALRLKHGTLPQTDALFDALAGKHDSSDYSLSDLKNKVSSLRSRYITMAKKGVQPSKDHDRRLLDISKMVWVSVPKASAGREPDEMCELYPDLAEEVMALEKAQPGLYKREFAMMDDSKARALDDKIKKQRVAEMKLHLRRHDLTKEVAETFVDLLEKK